MNPAGLKMLFEQKFTTSLGKHMDYPQEKPFPWKHVRLIGILPFDWEHPYIYHYIRYSHLKEMLNNFNGNGSLVLANPHNWTDPMESRFLSESF